MTSYQPSRHWLVEYTLANGSRDSAKFGTTIYCSSEWEAEGIWNRDYNNRGEYRIINVRLER